MSLRSRRARPVAVTTRHVLAFTLALAIVDPSRTAAAQRGGAIDGTLRGASAPSAAVELTRLRPEPIVVLDTRADARGVFRFDSLVPGDYALRVTTPILDSLELALPDRAVTIEAGRRTRVEIQMPSDGALREALCPGLALGKDRGVITGRAIDAVTEQPLAGAAVVVAWNELQMDRATPPSRCALRRRSLRRRSPVSCAAPPGSRSVPPRFASRGPIAARSPTSRGGMSSRRSLPERACWSSAASASRSRRSLSTFALAGARSATSSSHASSRSTRFASSPCGRGSPSSSTTAGEPLRLLSRARRDRAQEGRRDVGSDPRYSRSLRKRARQRRAGGLRPRSAGRGGVRGDESRRQRLDGRDGAQRHPRKPGRGDQALSTGRLRAVQVRRARVLRRARDLDEGVRSHSRVSPAGGSDSLSHGISSRMTGFSASLPSVRRLGLLATLLSATARSLGAQSGVGRIEGTITDSIHARPLASASVLAIRLDPPELRRGDE